MGQDPRDKLPSTSSTQSEEQVAEAQDNLKQALQAFDQQGGAGLQQQLEKLYPEVDQAPRKGLPNSWARVRRS